MSEDILMTPDACMRFLVWANYYHNILPEKNKSFKAYNKFSDDDVVKLDRLNVLLFKCFTKESVFNACKQLQQAKIMKETCPFAQEELDRIFAYELNK